MKTTAMFSFKKNVKTLNALRKDASTTKVVPDISRRAVTMIPDAAKDAVREIKDTVCLRFHHLLVSLEGGERTGCLKIISPRLKARSAILLYRGRVVGCVYGRKSMVTQYLANEAHKYALSDLAEAGNLVDAYELSEDLVLSAASLFSGQIMSISPAATIQEMIKSTVMDLCRSGLPGCVVVNTIDDEMICMIYVCRNKVIGVYSAADGWLNPTLEAGLSCLIKGERSKVMGAVLAQATEGRQAKLGFSLTGLGDRSYLAAPQAQALQSMARLKEAARVRDFSPEIGSYPQAPAYPSATNAHLAPNTTMNGLSFHPPRPLEPPYQHQDQQPQPHRLHQENREFAAPAQAPVFSVTPR